MKKVLIVDNSPDLLVLFTMIFKTDKVHVDCCDSLDSMFTSLQSSIPDLMILDVMRSGVDEKIIRNDLRKRIALSSTPIMITSTKKEHVHNYSFFGANDGIEKPFELTEIKEKVRFLLRA